MEENHINSKIKNLVIGDYVLSCYQGDKNLNIRIPYSGMAFYNPHSDEHVSDYEFEINSNKEPGDSVKLLFGSSDFFIPTFLFQNSDGSYEWMVRNSNQSQQMEFHISSDWKKFTLLYDHTQTEGSRVFQELGTLFSYAVLNDQACVLHGVVMEYEGKGILVLASAGTGKTTHTRMWRDYKNALILNGDRCLCRKKNGIWYAYGMPWSGSSGEYINRKVPISCIVSLNRGSQNYVEDMSLFEKTIYLMQRIFAPVWPGDLQNEGLEICEQMASEIPMLKLYCRPDLESVDVLKHALESRVW